MNLLPRLTSVFLLLAAPKAAALGDTDIVWGFSDYPPFKYVENGTYQGIDVLLMKEIAKRLGLTLKYYECPFKRCLELMKTGGIDFMTAIGLRDDRKDFVDFVFPPYNEKNAKVLYLRKNSGVSIKVFEDLYKYSIGVKNGVSYFPRFDQDDKINKQVVNEAEINLRKLEQGRIDAAINTEIQMDYLIIKHGFDHVFEKSVFRDESGADYIGISKKSKYAARKAEFEAIVADLVKSGRTKAFVHEFFDEIRAQARQKIKSAPAPVAPAPKP
jgi:polar amino acid transport system substrate-binding protein